MPKIKEVNPGNSHTGSPANKYKYNGKEAHDDWGVYDYGARFYDPVIRRFTTIDPMAEMYQSWSSYVYVMNNPLKYTDPTGMVTVTNHEIWP